ncbi:hypothetical protein DFH09DRAFT_497207 [Mycena vulgaris]|nr:hypothetical protein DFH09DRAFT_497207 [Mycena vulgaris]
MSFFPNSSHISIHDGTFYSAAGDVNIQNHQQFAIATSETNLGLGQGWTSTRPIGWGEYPQESSLAGPVRNPRAGAELRRLGPYDTAARRTQLSSQYPTQGHFNLSKYSSNPVSSDLWLINANRHIGWDTHGARPSLSAYEYPCPLQLPFTPPSSTPATFPTSGTSSQYPVDYNFRFTEYRTPGFSQDAPYMGPDPPLPYMPVGHVSDVDLGRHRQNTNPLRHEPTTINNGTFIGGNVNVKHGESGINILHRVSATAAFHDPADGHDQPRCHPETRLEMQEKLLNWCLNSEWPRLQGGVGLGTEPASGIAMNTEPAILWLHGPAGAGKSAIMKTLSQRLAGANRLGGAFFFKRGHPTRGNANVLFATIALQLAVNSPELELRISRIVEKNPTLVDRSIDVQLQELVLKPCYDLDGAPWIVMIDGLDECAGHDVQQHILRLMLNSTQHYVPLIFIIASRPEAHIREVLDESSFDGLCRSFNVESSFDDVRRYFVTEFARIHREHSTMASVPKPWPSTEVLERLVGKSSGYFIYASTVIKFVDDKNFRPVRRLETIENVTGTDSKSPFGALDELYTQILSAVPNAHHLLPILRVVKFFGNLLASEIDAFLGLESGDTALTLRGLRSVLNSKYGWPSFTHASFGDFLDDPCRSSYFFIGDSTELVELARLVLTEFGCTYDDRTKNRKHISWWWLTEGLGSLLTRVEPTRELVQLFREVNYDFLTPTNSDSILRWIERIQRPPNDLIRGLQDHRYLFSFNTNLVTPPDWNEISSQVMEQAAECSLLVSVAAAISWGCDLDFTAIRHLLNVTWGEIRAALCRLRPFLARLDSPVTVNFAKMLIHDWLITQGGTSRASICLELAWGCIRVRKLINTGRLPSYVWQPEIKWGAIIRGCPPCPELLHAIHEFIPPHIPSCFEGQEQDCYDVIQ